VQANELMDEISGKLAQVDAILNLVIADGGEGDTLYNAVWGARDISSQAKRLVEELSCLLNPYPYEGSRSLIENPGVPSASTTD